jgi:hypothetical protein
MYHPDMKEYKLDVLVVFTFLPCWPPYLIVLVSTSLKILSLIIKIGLPSMKHPMMVGQGEVNPGAWYDTAYKNKAFCVILVLP